MKKFKKIMAIGCAAVMAFSAIGATAFATEINSEETVYFVQTDKDGNEIRTIPLVKTEAGYRQAELQQRERATKPIWDLSSKTYTNNKNGYALYTFPYRFTGTASKYVCITANMTLPGGDWAELAMNNVTNGTTYMGSVELDKVGNLFNISGKLHGISSNNYYTYTLSGSTNCTYAEVEISQK